MNGWEMCQQLRKLEETKHIPIIMLTSRDSKRDQQKQKGAGVKAYLTKPCTVDKILVLVERILAQSKMERERELLKHYVSDAALAEVSQRIKFGKTAEQMRAKELFTTVMFTDLASFTDTCEKMSPQELINLLNDYYDTMVPCVLNNSGVIDKFIGDAIMAIFCDVDKGAVQACRAGLQMLESLNEFNKSKSTPLKMRIGINSGKLFMGDIGSKYARRDFTVIGDAVNLASRLESVGKEYGVNFIVSEDTYNLAKSVFLFRKLDVIRVKGKKKPVAIFEVIGEIEKIDANIQKKILIFQQAIDYYFNKDWQNAILKFKEVLRLDDADKPTEKYIYRCENFVKNPPAADWDGVFEMKNK